MSGESSGASSGDTPSLTPTMASTSSTSSTSENTTSAMSTTSDEMLSASLVPTTSVTSDSSSPSMSSSSTNATTPATITDSSSSFPSLYSGTSSSPPQTSTTIEQAQTTSPVPSITTSASVLEPLPTIGGGVLATSTQTSSSGNSFFNDRGAVAGTFVVVAIVAAAAFACLCYAWRRRLQRRNRNQMFKTITWPRDDQRLQAEPGDQPITSMPSDSISKPNYRSDAFLHSIRAEGMQTAGISVPATRGITNQTGPSYEGLFSDYVAKDHISRDLSVMNITTNLRPDSPVPSLTPSTPSMYPPSLPPMEIESNVTGSTVHSTPFSLPSMSPPPRPSRQRRPPPPSSWKHTETTTMPSSPTLVPPYTLDSISPSSIPNQSRTDSQLRSMTAAFVLHRPTRADVRSDRENTSFSKSL